MPVIRKLKSKIQYMEYIFDETNLIDDNCLQFIFVVICMKSLLNFCVKWSLNW